jgi:hypothetical protein
LVLLIVRDRSVLDRLDRADQDLSAGLDQGSDVRQRLGARAAC